MSNLALGLAGVGVLLVVLFLRVPIGVALALVGVGGYAAVDGWRKALTVIGSVPFELASAYSLSVVPLFILMGAVASRAGMSRELFSAANAIFSGWRGALANATIGACAAFGSICGSSIATAATFSKVAIPEMRRHGYDDGLAAGCVASAGTLGILIPPSVILAIYALVAEQSLSTLFAAALIPGLLLAALYIVVVTIIARVRPQWTPKVPGMKLGERLRAAMDLWKLGLLFFLAVVGIYLGWFSPTEAAAVAAFAAVVIGVATGGLNLAGLFDALLDTVYATAMLFFIIVGAFIFSRFIVLTRLPNELVAWTQQAALVALGDRARGGAALLPARHLPRGGQHHPGHRAGDHAADGEPRLRRHLVRHLRHRDGHHRPHQPAGRPDRVRDPGPESGHPGGEDLPRHAPLPGRGLRPRRPANRIPKRCVMASRAAAGLNAEPVM